MVGWPHSRANSTQLPHVQGLQMTRGDSCLGSSEPGGLGDDHSSPDAHKNSSPVQNANSPNADQIDPTASLQPMTRARSPVASMPIGGQGNLGSCQLHETHANNTPVDQGISTHLSPGDHEGNVNRTSADDSQGVTCASSSRGTVGRRDTSDLNITRETRSPGGQVSCGIDVVRALVILISSLPP
jgi:hypothetical protein